MGVVFFYLLSEVILEQQQNNYEKKIFCKKKKKRAHFAHMGREFYTVAFLFLSFSFFCFFLIEHFMKVYGYFNFNVFYRVYQCLDWLLFVMIDVLINCVIKVIRKYD